MDWNRLKTFHAVARAGSCYGAQDQLNLSQSAISRQIGQLEESLKVSLFHRHARGVKLTEQGELLESLVGDILGQLSFAEARLWEYKGNPSGPLRVSTTAGFAAFWLATRLTKFYESFPEIAITLMIDGGLADLSMGEADVVIRMSAPSQVDVVQRRLFTWSSHALASPDYLRRRGGPSCAEDLDRHRLITQSTSRSGDALGSAWLLDVGANPASPRQPVAVVEDINSLYRAALGGLGIVALPDFISFEATGLVRVLPELSSPKTDCYFAYSATLRNSKRIAVFRDFLVREIAACRPRSSPAGEVIHLPIVDRPLPTPMLRMPPALAEQL